MPLFRVMVQDKASGHWRPLVDRDGIEVAPTTSRRVALNRAELAHRSHYRVKVQKVDEGSIQP